MQKTNAPPRASDLRNHGIAVRQGSCLSLAAWRDPETGRDAVFAGINSSNSLVVQMDIASGRCRSFELPDPCGGPWGMAFTLEGDLLVTSVSGHLCRIDPRSGKVRISANAGHWLWSITRAADGQYYLGSSIECRLFRYDAATETMTDLGRLDPREKYLRAVWDGDDGYLYGSIGCTAAQVVAYHIASGRFKSLLPKTEERPGFHSMVGRNGDGRVLVRTGGGHLYRLAHGEAFPIPDGASARRLFKRLYHGSLVTLPDGRPVRYLDPDAIQIGEGKAARIRPLTYRTDGAGIFHLAEGPGRAVYASTIMPLYLLRYTPATDTLENLGRGAPDNGEAYSIGHCNGKLYYACYSYGNLMCYDPAKPWHRDPPGGMTWKTNPRLLGNLGKGHNRPRAMCVDRRQRVWVGSIPEYGCRGGGLACYDTAAQTLVNRPVIIPDQSIIALTADAAGDTIYGATSVGGGSGTEPVTRAAHLFAWDARRNKLRWTAAPWPEMSGILNLLWHDGYLYGTTADTHGFFRFDPERRRLDYFLPSNIGGAREQSIGLGLDGNIYGITWIALFRWRPETGGIDVLYRCEGARANRQPGGSLFHRGAVIIDGRFYFSSGARVMSLRLPTSIDRCSAGAGFDGPLHGRAP